MEDEENKKLLREEVENYDKYEKENILYSIWGNKWKKFFKEQFKLCLIIIRFYKKFLIKYWHKNNKWEEKKENQ